MCYTHIIIKKKVTSMDNTPLAEAKIHILYLVSEAPGVSYQMLMNRCLDSLYVDYFAFTQAVNELISGNLMDKSTEDTGTGEAVGGSETLTLTAGGIAVLNDLKGTLNNNLESHLISQANKLKEEVTKINKSTAVVKPASDGTFTLTLKDTGSSSNPVITLTVSSSEEADIISKNWRKESESITKDLLKKLLE